MSNLQFNWRSQRWSTPLGNADLEATALALQHHAQVRRSRKPLGRCRPKQDRHRATRLGRHLQAPQHRVLGRITQPEKNCAARTRAQRLLRRPERILATRRPNNEALLEREPALGESRRIRKVLRIDPRDHPLTLAGQRERRDEKRHFADPHSIVQHFGECSRRPASAGKLAIESRVAGGERRLGRVLELATAPNSRMLC